jgi:hypothetical protein
VTDRFLTDTETVYNFGVLTKRYELVSRTAGHFAPAVAGAAAGFLMIVAGVPEPVPFLPVLLGFWFALGKVPFGARRGTPVRAMVVPLVRYAMLRLGHRERWEMPFTWRTVAVHPATSQPSVTATADRDSGTPLLTRRRRSRRMRSVPSEQLPPELGQLRWLSTTLDGAEAGLLSERIGRRGLVTAVVSVSGGDRFVFSGPDEQATQISRWGEVLKALAADGPGLRRLQWVERATPQPSTVQSDWSAAAMAGVPGEELADYQTLLTSIGTAAIHHDVYLGAQVETEAGPRLGAAGSDTVSEVTTELAQLCEHLRSIGLRPKALSIRGIASVMRQWADPTTAERLALWGEESIPPSQAGPASRLVGYDTLRTDGYVHRVGQVAAWPRIDVGTEWMYPLLATALPGSVRTVSMHFEAVSTEQALQEVRDARTTGGMAQRKRDEKGIITTDTEERRVDEARSRERELTGGFRQHKIAGLVMVSSPDPETAASCLDQAQRKAVECHLDLRETHARGHEAWAATLPLCRLRFSRGLV